MAKLSFPVYCLNFHTPLHIGDKRPDDYGNSEKYIPSDVLQAAVIACWAKMGLDINDGATGFTISSLFPFATIGDKKTFFFPKLMKRLPIASEIVDRQTGLAKKIKKVLWLDQHYFEKQLNDTKIEDFGENDQHLQKAYCSRNFAQEKKPAFLNAQIQQRVTVPRDWTSGAGDDPVQRNTFYTERLFFKGDAGLFFLFSGDQEAQKKLESALNLLQYEGIGTDRSTGNGQFTWKSETLTLEVPDQTNYRTNLSLLCPESRETLLSWLGTEPSNPKFHDSNIAFSMVKRGGWITTPGKQKLRKQSIFMFKEGGLFRTTASTAGQPRINLTPTASHLSLDHQIWRNGESLMIPVKPTNHE